MDFAYNAVLGLGNCLTVRVGLPFNCKFRLHIHSISVRVKFEIASELKIACLAQRNFQIWSLLGRAQFFKSAVMILIQILILWNFKVNNMLSQVTFNFRILLKLALIDNKNGYI